MSDPAPALPSPTTMRAMLAGAAYRANAVRLTGRSLAGSDCLVASRQGLFAVGRDGSTVEAAHGFFFGVRPFADGVLLFEACDRPYGPSRRGRLVHLRWRDGRLADPIILAKGLDNQCHQVAVFDDAIWLVDTANQAIRQFALDGTPVATHAPFPFASRDDTSGAYLHLNGIAKIGDRIAVMLHNGRADPPRTSELAWLDADLRPVVRVPLPGRSCHDIVADTDGVLWHCDSMAGDLITSAGTRMRVTDRMTRGLAVAADEIVVGASDFATRAHRDAAPGSVIFIDRRTDARIDVAVPGAPTDLILL